MNEKIYKTPCGDIHYWINMEQGFEHITLIFLPGLTADHRLFDKQNRIFRGKIQCACMGWRLGMQNHGHSNLIFSLMDKAKWLDDILCLENIHSPVIIGQSMGGYVGQAYSELFPDKLKGFVSIDSAPLQRNYVTKIELWLLKEWNRYIDIIHGKSLLKTGTKGVATSSYGRKLMHEIMMTYDGSQKRYARIAGTRF